MSIEMTMPKVEERQAYFGAAEGRKRIEAKGFKMLVEPDTDRVFSIVTDDYQLVRHEDVIEMAEAVCGEMKEYGEPERRIWLPQEGAKMRAEYVFPEVEYRVGGNGDVVHPRFEMFNSYDGGWALRGLFGAYRLVCTNGLVSGKKLAEFRREHHQPMNGTEDLKRVIVGGMEQMSDQIALWKTWLDRALKPQEYDKITKGMNWTKMEQGGLIKLEEAGSGTKLEEFVDEEGKAKDAIQAVSMWVFYNLVTQYITHKVESQIKQARLMARAGRLFR